VPFSRWRLSEFVECSWGVGVQALRAARVVSDARQWNKRVLRLQTAIFSLMDGRCRWVPSAARRNRRRNDERERPSNHWSAGRWMLRRMPGVIAVWRGHQPVQDVLDVARPAGAV